MIPGGRLPRLAIIVPARNEGARVGDVLAGLPGGLDGIESVRIVVVDDGSSDNTSTVARTAGAAVFKHAVNLGKGAALRTGCEAAIREGCDILAFMDADGQHQASDLGPLLEPLLAGRADLVLGTRRFTGDMPAAMRLGNWGLSGIFGVLFGHRFSDTQSGMRALTAEAYPQVRWEATNYAVETEMLVRAARARLRVEEVVIQTVYHDAYKGTTIADGVKILGAMVRWRAVR